MDQPIHNIILCLTLTLIFSALIQPSLSELCHPQDKKVLLQIKKAFNDPYVLASWDPLTDCCEWYLVSCHEKTHRIISLHVNSEGLSGQIPPPVADLPYLETLLFARQPNLRGPIQPAIAKLKNLRFLTITSTNVSGSIPDFIGTELGRLEFLDLSRNALTGRIPSTLALLPSLGGLRLDVNKLTGLIPDSFGEFRKSGEFYLYLSFNQLSGPIPSSMGKTSFALVDLSRNKLVGDPSGLFGPDKGTEHVDLSRNLFAFDLTKVRISRDLAWLDLSHNGITGSIPSGMAVPSLRHLDVSYNQLCGKIPVGGNLQGLNDASSYVHNRCLCGAPLKIKCK